MRQDFRFKVGTFVFLLVVFVIANVSFCFAAPKGIEGYVLTPMGGRANHSSVIVHVIATVGIGLSIPCTTTPLVYSDSAGYYISNLANLKRDDNGNDCGSLWFTGDDAWADVNGSTSSPYPYGSQNSSVTAIPDVSGVTIALPNTTLLNYPPSITGIDASDANGGNISTVIPIGADDNGDNLSLICCFDTSNTCNPTLATNQCNGNWENVTYPYTAMNCTYAVLSGIDIDYYARCRVKEYQYQTGVVSTGFIVDGTPPSTTDDFSYNDTWVKTDQAISLSADCSLVSCNWTYYCTENDSCTPHLNYSGPIPFTEENISYLRYHTQDLLGKYDDIVSYRLKIDKGAPLKENAAITIENGTGLITESSVNFNWSGFSDNLSGIAGYYYSFSNNEGTSSGTFDADSPGVLANAPQGLINIFVWAIDAAGNIGLAVNDTVITDSEGPDSGIYNITEDSGGEYTYYSASTSTFCYADQAASFTILINATDQTGLGNATGSLAFGDSPIDYTPAAGDYQYELSYSIETPTPIEASINITVYDNLTNHRNITLYTLKDIYQPGSVDAEDIYSFWSPAVDVDMTWNASYDQCGVREYYWNVDNGTNTTTGNLYANTTNTDQANHTFYLYATDRMGNSGLVGSNRFGIDTTPPSAPAYTSIEADYDNDGSYTVSWGAVTDISGIIYELFESDNSGAWISIQNTTSSSAVISGRLDNHDYSYFTRARNGAGLIGGNSTASGSILVDTTHPYITNVENSELNHTDSGPIRVNATIGDDVSGFNTTPFIFYKYGNDAWSSGYNMTLIAGDSYEGNYTYPIPEPGSGWSSYRGQIVYYNITITDRAGNTNMTQYTFPVTSVNRLEFHVKDRILGHYLNDVNITGGTQCSAGCVFDRSINISEINGNYSFTIKKAGFSSNTTSISVNTEDPVINVLLDDITAPTVSFINYSVRSASNTTFYAKVYANITENHNIDSAFLHYNLTDHVTDSGISDFTSVGGDVYAAEIGPYNDSFYMTSSIFVNDSYGYKDNETLANLWFVYGGAGTGIATYSSEDYILQLRKGWNIISIPFVGSDDLRTVLGSLSNGNWGCGRDIRIPIQCNESAGDFMGNFTKVMEYNTTEETWASFDPQDYYVTIDDQELQTLKTKRGYWINMTQDQNITLDLKFD